MKTCLQIDLWIKRNALNLKSMLLNAFIYLKIVIVKKSAQSYTPKKFCIWMHSL